MQICRVSVSVGVGIALNLLVATVVCANALGVVISSAKGQEMIADAMVFAKQVKEFHLSCLEKMDRGLGTGSQDCAEALAHINWFARGMSLGSLKPEDLEAFRNILLVIKDKSEK
ncbi:MAG: hypothetical protein KL863_19845 [Rhizobium sp.]|nr:hypothetical protein [Rhizobium sp.]